jgi:hypothetical protein
MQMLLLWLQFYAQEPCGSKQKERLENGQNQTTTLTFAHENETPRPLSAWDRAVSEAEEAYSKYAQTQSNDDLPSCLVPDTERTASIVKDAMERRNRQTGHDNEPLIPLPVLNMGMPKCGSTTLHSFFKCIGLKTTHWDQGTNEFEGLCMRDAVAAGLPPLKTCAAKTDALMQMDVTHPFGWKTYMYHSIKHRDECFFPQLSLLDEFHEENPNVTFILNFRPIDHWIESLVNWGNMLARIRDCNLPNQPRGVPEDLDDMESVKHTFMVMFCSQVIHLRNFVEEHGHSHALIELDLYDQETSKNVLSSLFPSTKSGQSSEKCYKHKNKSKG